MDWCLPWSPATWVVIVGLLWISYIKSVDKVRVLMLIFLQHKCWTWCTPFLGFPSCLPKYQKAWLAHPFSQICAGKRGNWKHLQVALIYMWRSCCYEWSLIPSWGAFRFCTKAFQEQIQILVTIYSNAKEVGIASLVTETPEVATFSKLLS